MSTARFSVSYQLPNIGVLFSQAVTNINRSFAQVGQGIVDSISRAHTVMTGYFVDLHNVTENLIDWEKIRPENPYNSFTSSMVFNIGRVFHFITASIGHIFYDSILFDIPEQAKKAYDLTFKINTQQDNPKKDENPPRSAYRILLGLPGRCLIGWPLRILSGVSLVTGLNPLGFTKGKETFNQIVHFFWGTPHSEASANKQLPWWRQGIVFGALNAFVAIPVVGASALIWQVTYMIGSIVAGVLLTVIQTIASVVQFIGTVVAIILLKIIAAMVMVAKFIGSVISKIATTVWKGITIIANAVGRIIYNIACFIGSVISKIATTLWKGITIVANVVGNILQNIAAAVWYVLSTIAQAVWYVASTIAKAVWTGIKVIAQSAWYVLSHTAQGIWAGIKAISRAIIKVVSAIKSAVWIMISTAGLITWNIASAILSPIWKAIKFVAACVFSIICTTAAFIWAGITTVASVTATVVSAVASTLWAGIVVVANAIATVASTIASALWIGIKVVAEVVSKIVSAIATVAAHTINLTANIIGLSTYSYHNVLYTLKKCSNYLFGTAFDSGKNIAYIQTIKSQNTLLSLCAQVGVIGLTTKVIVGTLTVTAALLGLSATNYHRLQLWWKEIRNENRTKKEALPTAEHLTFLEAAHKDTLSRRLSEYNLVRGATHAAGMIAKFVLWPASAVIFAGVRLSWNIVKFAFKPVTWSLSKCFPGQVVSEDLNTLIKNLTIFQNRLNLDGTIPGAIDPESRPSLLEEQPGFYPETVKQTYEELIQNKPLIERIGFWFAKEIRKCFSLGFLMTIEEKVIKAFKDEAIAYALSREGKEGTVQGFLNNHYQALVERIVSDYGQEKEQLLVRRMAWSLRYSLCDATADAPWQREHPLPTPSAPPQKEGEVVVQSPASLPCVPGTTLSGQDAKGFNPEYLGTIATLAHPGATLEVGEPHPAEGLAPLGLSTASAEGVADSLPPPSAPPADAEEGSIRQPGSPTNTRRFFTPTTATNSGEPGETDLHLTTKPDTIAAPEAPKNVIQHLLVFA